MGITPRLGLPYPEGSDSADVPRDVRALAQAVDSAAFFSQGMLAARPPAGVQGRFYRAQDTGALYLDTGAAWVQVGQSQWWAGAIAVTATSSAPTGWLLCNGSPVRRDTYAALFAAIGTTYGAGDGASTFNVPDLRGRAPIGAGSVNGLTPRNRGEQVGAETHTLTPAQIPSHTHTMSPGGAHTHDAPQGLFVLDTGPSTWAQADPDGGAAVGDARSLAIGPSGDHTHTIANTGGDGPHNNMQPSLVCQFVICHTPQ